MSKRRKATDISSSVRKEIHKRDKHCIVCGSRWGLQIAHIHLPRSRGGLGTKENLALMCYACHNYLDHGTGVKHDYIKEIAVDYMLKLYPETDIRNLKYQKGKDYVRNFYDN